MTRKWVIRSHRSPGRGNYRIWRVYYHGSHVCSHLTWRLAMEYVHRKRNLR